MGVRALDAGLAPAFQSLVAPDEERCFCTTGSKKRPRNMMNVSLELILFNFHTDLPTRRSAQQGVTFRMAFRPHVFAHLSVCDRRQAALQRMLTQRGLQKAAGLHIGGEATRSILHFHDLFSLLCFCFRLYCFHMCNLCCQALCEARVVPHIEGRMFVCLSEPKTC